MKRTTALVIVLAITLFTPQALGAAKRSYAGEFATSGTLAFDVKKSKRGKKVVEFRFKRFPLDCERGPNTVSGGLTFAVDVKRRKFETVALENPDNPKAKLKLDGRLQGRTAAKGSMSVEGRKVLVTQGKRDRCSSGDVPWTATREG